MEYHGKGVVNAQVLSACFFLLWECGHLMKIYVAWHAEQRLNNSTIEADGPTPAAFSCETLALNT